MTALKFATRLTKAMTAFCLLCPGIAPGAASAQPLAWPDKPIRIVVGFPAGGASDMAARAVGRKLSERLGQPVVVDNRPGAASNIAADMVAHAPADGYSILLGTIALSINPSLYPKLSFDPLRDLIPVSMIASSPFLLVVNPRSPFKSVNGLIAGANSPSRQGSKELFYASAGNGSGAHLFTELFASTAGIHLAHVPYKGASAAMSDVLADVVPITFDNIITTLPLVKAGKLRALGVSSKQRSKVAPEIPTLHEMGVVGFDATSWFGLFVPAGTPKEIVTRLNRETAEALKDPSVRDSLLAVGAEPVGSSQADFAGFYRSELEKWRKVVREGNVRID
jgi:tripartite-type tricarboxylate transporter receptor subunit TctC